MLFEEYRMLEGDAIELGAPIRAVLVSRTPGFCHHQPYTGRRVMPAFSLHGPIVEPLYLL